MYAARWRTIINGIISAECEPPSPQRWNGTTSSMEIY